MVFLSLVHLLCDRPMQRRFDDDPAFRATNLLLQERVPRTTTVINRPPALSAPVNEADSGADRLRVYTSAATFAPEVHLLSNGAYHVVVTNSGGGYSRWRDLAITRWREDTTRDCWGAFGYLRDLGTGAFWSVAHQPTLRLATSYEAIFSPGRAEFRRLDGDIYTHVEISVSPEDDIELRRVCLNNRGRTSRTLELTSYAEVVLASASSDVAHPAFSNLFVQTEILADQQAILVTRRPRSKDEHPPWMFHHISVHGTSFGTPSFETARVAFLGRGRTPADPIAMHNTALTDTHGAVLDPIVAIRSAVVLEPQESAYFHIVTGVAETREGAMALLEKFRDRHAAARVLELSWTHSQVVQRRLAATDLDIQTYERLATHILFSNPTMRAPAGLIGRNRGGQSGLWAYGISGDLPIMLVRIADFERLELVQQLVKAHAYWRYKGLSAELVIWIEDPSGYRQTLMDEIVAVIGAVSETAWLDKPGGIFVRRSEQISEPDKILMSTLARVLVSDGAGTLAEQMERLPVAPQASAPVGSELGSGHTYATSPIEFRPPRAGPPRLISAHQRPDLHAFNGLGGFTPDGREYIIVTDREHKTAAPWVNVIANPFFGTVISESGSAYTWCENAHSYRLTPWSNDPVSDLSGEAFFIRDEDDGHFWSPTPTPAGPDVTFTSRHGFGYSIFECVERGLASTMTTYVATDAPVKFVVLRIANRSGRTRRLTLTGYYELVLGDHRATHVPHVVTELDLKTSALTARNAYSVDFSERVAFLDCSEMRRAVSGDRTEFIGRNGSLSSPAAMRRTRLSGRVGAALDPSLAMQASIELVDGQEREVAFIFGSGRDLADARLLISRFRGTGAARTALEGVWGHWNHTLGAIHVKTPDPALDMLANGWLVYQVLAARLWGRSGFYQSGGAFGFRDQLQDAMALVHAEPIILREQLLRAAAHQFREGDVQHWWHPPRGRGVRTTISDDYLWLPHAICRYVAAIGDTGVLDERIPFLDGRPVLRSEDSYYDLPVRSEDVGTLYEHAVRAVKNGLRFGSHGLPLMGGGDWNDGMNLVGREGQGESIWLGFFLYDVLVRFGALAVKRGDLAFAEVCSAEAERLRTNLEAHGWDGDWYRRAYFDSGAPLGSAQNVECQIDAIPQSWAQLSGAGEPARVKLALASVDKRLVRRDLGLIALFEPPFDDGELDPGYVKGYVPGVRENGGQYTHAAVWTVMAFAEAGEVEKAWELLSLINPIHHGDNAANIARYKVEPYVVAADVYVNPQHAGRGGWTWYTGSAGWMYRLIVESLLGLHLEVDRLRFAPKIPASWPGFEVDYRHRDTPYHIRVKNLGGGHRVVRVVCDSVVQPDATIALTDDRQQHQVEVEIGA
jgi:cellobiose phosphorylase